MSTKSRKSPALVPHSTAVVCLEVIVNKTTPHSRRLCDLEASAVPTSSRTPPCYYNLHQQNGFLAHGFLTSHKADGYTVSHSVLLPQSEGEGERKNNVSVTISSVQSLSRVRLFVTP